MWHSAARLLLPAKLGGYFSTCWCRQFVANEIEHLALNIGQPVAENESVVDALGLPPDDLGAEWPRFRHARRPDFLLTLPHSHGTSGFFVARLRRP